MKILLVSPRTPDTFWSFKHAVRFVSRKASMPPLGLLTVAAMLPPVGDKHLARFQACQFTADFRPSLFDCCSLNFQLPAAPKPGEGGSTFSGFPRKEFPMNPKAEFKNRSWLQLKNLLAVQAGVLLLCLAAASGKAQTYKILHSFTGSDGAYPGQANLTLSGSTLYGTTRAGGITNSSSAPYGDGTVFAINTDGTGFTVLKTFAGGSGGSGPSTGLVLSGTTLYGTTGSGGSSNYGTVFKVNTDGTGFTVLNSFTEADGFYPSTGLALSGTTLYGATDSGGVLYNGTVFKVNTDGTGFAVLKYFAESNGILPEGSLLLSGTTLYGTTTAGGIDNSYAHYGSGTVFEVNTDGTGFTVLKYFTGPDGYSPIGSLTLSGSTLYGTTSGGGSSGDGVVFKVNTDGSNYTMLHQFTNSGGRINGMAPVGGLVLSGTTLYGTTSQGGITNSFNPYGIGTVFTINTDGSGFTVLKTFAGGSDGVNPWASLVLSGTTLYGTTDTGGSANCGVVFSLSIAPPSLLTPPQSQTAEFDSTVNFKPDVAGDPVMTCEWFFNGTNRISCSQNCNLELTSVQYSQSGSYTVVVTNLFGAVTSSPAMLNVIAPVTRRPVPGVQVMGETGSLLNVDYANSLNPAPNWTAVGTVSLTSTSQYCFDVTVPVPLPPQRFYRAWQSGTPSVVPSLNSPGILQAITLTGNAGDSLRLDCINQLGPTNAWVTLGTITLTNTSQLYFDVSAIGQPPRLYQIVPVP